MPQNAKCESIKHEYTLSWRNAFCRRQMHASTARQGVLRCGEVSQQTVAQGHELPRRALNSGATILRKAAATVADRRIRLGPGSGHYGRRVDARPESDLAILRAQSMKRSASGVSVRSLTVMNPTGAGGGEILTGRALMRICLPPKCMTEAGTRPSQRPVSIKRM